MTSDYVDDPADDDYDGLTLVTVLPGVSVTTTPPLIVPIDSPHGTELEAATSELSRNSCLRTAI